MKNRLRVLIFGLSYHGRAVYRSLDRNIYDIVGFLDNNIEKKGQVFGSAEVYHPRDIDIVDFDMVIISGRYIDSMTRQLVDDLFVDEEKIIVMGRSEIIPNDKSLEERENIFLDMFLNFKKIVDDKGIKYWIGFSSLLALKRGEKFSKFSDLDIGITSEQASLFVSELKESCFPYNIKISRYSGHSKYWKNGDISSISMTDKVDSVAIEPAIIDIHVLNNHNGKIYIKFINDEFFVLPYSYFDGNSVINYSGFDFSVPKNVEGYLSLIYGDNWESPVERWQQQQYNSKKLK